MKQQAFERQREGLWNRFNTRLNGVTRGYRLEEGAQAERFLYEYRAVARDLSLAQSRGYSRQLINRLNDMVVRGHNTIYAYRSSYTRVAFHFLTREFARRVRQEWRFVLAAALLFYGPFVAMTATVLLAPDYIYSVMSAEQVRSFESMYDPAARTIGPERDADSNFAMFGFYIFNNISIGFQSFAGGLLFGVITIVVLVFNGTVLGATSGYLTGIGFTETFLSFVAGHSALELNAIVLTGAAGLMLGYSLIAPQGLRRAESLKRMAKRAVDLVFGATAMLLGAAFIEAFFSASGVLPVAIKYTFGIGMWVLVILYFVWAGRRAT